jgi:hypothetical protein
MPPSEPCGMPSCGGSVAAARIARRGSRFVERIVSIRETCRQQGLGPLEYLVECCHARLDGQRAPSLLPGIRSQPEAA